MKILVKKSGVWAHRGIELVEIKDGVHEHKNLLANELIANDWAIPYVDEPKGKDIPQEYVPRETIIKDPSIGIENIFDREAAEEEYRELGGRPRSDWSDEELAERIEAKKAE